MKHPDMKQPKAPTGADKPPKKPRPEAFDVWLTRGLHRIYDGVANEPIPDELLNLIEQDRTK